MVKKFIKNLLMLLFYKKICYNEYIMKNNLTLQQLNFFNNAPETISDFTFIDLFAGIGGIRRAFDKIGGKCVFSSEIDKYAIQTYFANFGEIPSGDITKIDEKTIPKFDILLAGFPCQAFSIAGKRQGFNDTRGTMFFEIQRILEYHKPKCFLLENVKGLLNHDKGKTFKTIRYKFKERLKNGTK